MPTRCQFSLQVEATRSSCLEYRNTINMLLATPAEFEPATFSLEGCQDLPLRV